MLELITGPFKKLLFVDDDIALHMLMTAIFQSRGFIVDIAADGRTALEWLRREPYDVVILDLMLPDPNGFEIVRELKSRDPALLARTIILTAAHEVELRDFADAGRVRRVMSKPFDVGELIAEVRACASAAQEEDSGRARPQRVC